MSKFYSFVNDYNYNYNPRYIAIIFTHTFLFVCNNHLFSHSYLVLINPM